MPKIIDPEPAATGPRSVFARQALPRRISTCIATIPLSSSSGILGVGAPKTDRDQDLPSHPSRPSTALQPGGGSGGRRTGSSSSKKRRRLRSLGPAVVREPAITPPPRTADDRDDDDRHRGDASVAVPEKRQCSNGVRSRRPHDGSSLLVDSASAAVGVSFAVHPCQGLGIDVRPGRHGGEEGDASRASLLLAFVSDLKARVAGATGVNRRQRPFPNWVTTTAATVGASEAVVALEDLDVASIALSSVPRYDSPPVQQRHELPDRALPTRTANAAAAATAEASWEAMGDMVIRLVKRTTTSKGESTPIHVTLLTFEATLLIDHGNPSSVESHRSALRDWKRRLQAYWDEGQLGQVHVVVVTDTPETWDSAAAARHNSWPRDSSSASPSTVLTLLRSLQAECQGVDPLARVPRPAVLLPPGDMVGSVLLTAVPQCAIAYQQLVRSWLQPYLSVQTAQLELPATRDGTQCVLQIAASYHTMPFAVDSLDFRRLQVDLRHLTRLSVVQTVAANTVDASLLFGVPVTVEVALQDGWEATRDMEGLVRALFRYLHHNRVALLLNNGGCRNGGCRNGGCRDRGSDEGLFEGRTHGFGHNGGDDSDGDDRSFFVLLPRVVTAGAATSGLLFRYASAAHLTANVTDGCAGSSSSTGAMASNFGERNELDSYMEEALDGMLAPHNPLHERLIRRGRRGRDDTIQANRDRDGWDNQDQTKEEIQDLACCT